LQKTTILHTILFAIFPVLLIYSQNIHLLPIAEIIFPLFLIVGVSLIAWKIITYFFDNKFKSGLLISLFLVLFFSYGHVYNLLVDTSIFDFDIGRHRFLLIPFVISLVAASVFIIKTSRKLNNLSSIVTVISLTAVMILFVNVSMDISQENFFDSSLMSSEENFLGTGASRTSGIELFYSQKSLRDIPENIQSSSKPDIYYIILDEYGSNHALKNFFNHDNSSFTDSLLEKNFFIFEPSFTNYPTTVQSLGSTLNMKYINYLSDQTTENSKNYHLLNDVLSKNEVMKVLKQNDYFIINMGALWGPNNSFHFSDIDLCEFKEFNRDSLMRELLQITMLSYVQERLVEEGRRDRVLCVFEELPELQKIPTNPKFVFAHIMLPHAPYIFGPNGESITPGNSLDGMPWEPRKAHVDQIKFANQKIITLLNSILTYNTNSIIIIQGDTGSSFENDWNSPSNELIIERMSNLNAIYMPDNNYSYFEETTTPVNTFRIIMNEIFDKNYEMLPDKMYWSTSNLPYLHDDVTQLLEDTL
tara:strand:- start:677 stop:2266 length:1590 start_codon:yes stop_codon:yes gene_type:complete